MGTENRSRSFLQPRPRVRGHGEQGVPEGAPPLPSSRQASRLRGRPGRGAGGPGHGRGSAARVDRGRSASPAVGSAGALAGAVGSSGAAAGSSEGRRRRAWGRPTEQRPRWPQRQLVTAAIEEPLRTQTWHHSTGKEPLAFLLLPSQARTQLRAPQHPTFPVRSPSSSSPSLSLQAHGHPPSTPAYTPLPPHLPSHLGPGHIS